MHLLEVMAPTPPGGRCWAGLDGCRTGWVLALVRAGAAGSSPSISLHGRLGEAVDAAIGLGAATIGIDIPIGLSEDGRRMADLEARALLGTRRSTVFPTPVRAVLDAVDYRDALARSRLACGKGLSKQAWNLMPKIREADELVRPHDEQRLFEVHPELAFSRLAGEVLLEPKKTPHGRARRLALLGTALGLDDDAVRMLGAQRPGPGAAADDVTDAVAVALSARALDRGTGTILGDGERDRRGRTMRICF